MGFGDLKSDAGVAALNTFLGDKSYVEGYVPSQGDVAIFESMSGAPNAKYCHALRWYKHILSYKSQFGSLPGVKKPLAEYGPAGGAQVNGGAGGDDDDDSDIDLFGSDDEEETAERERIREERLAQYAAKKSKKPGPIAKSNIILDVKPWDDETDMKKVEECVRSIVADGLLWGSSKLAPVGYGIMKLQITCVVEDDKIGTDFLEEEITKFENLVQSVDIAAFNKI